MNYLDSCKYIENGIYVFILNDADAVAARSLEEAISWYEECTGCTRKNGEIFENRDIKKQDLNEKMYIDENRDVKETVRSQIRKTNKFPCLIWSTEY